MLLVVKNGTKLCIRKFAGECSTRNLLVFDSARVQHDFKTLNCLNVFFNGFLFFESTILHKCLFNSVTWYCTKGMLIVYFLEAIPSRFHLRSQRAIVPWVDYPGIKHVVYLCSLCYTFTLHVHLSVRPTDTKVLSWNFSIDKMWYGLSFSLKAQTCVISFNLSIHVTWLWNARKVVTDIKLLKKQA